MNYSDSCAPPQQHRLSGRLPAPDVLAASRLISVSVKQAAAQFMRKPGSHAYTWATVDKVHPPFFLDRSFVRSADHFWTFADGGIDNKGMHNATNDAGPYLVSIITVCLNSERHIEQTLESVRTQKNVACEHIVIDGGSTDRTTEILASRLLKDGSWISGPDAGIADAMNKGIRLSRGEWLLVVQSDDYLLGDEVLAKALEQLTTELDIGAFPIHFGDEDSPALIMPPGVGFRLNLKGLHHQGVFIRRSLFERLGLYDTSFGIMMDYEFFLRAYRAGARFQQFANPAISMMRDSGISSRLDWLNLKKRFDEEKRVHRTHQTRWLSWFYDAWWMLYPRYRQLRAHLSHRSADGSADGG